MRFINYKITGNLRGKQLKTVNTCRNIIYVKLQPKSIFNLTFVISEKDSETPDTGARSCRLRSGRQAEKSLKRDFFP